MVGVPVFLGLDFAPHRAVAQVAGAAVRIGRAPFTRLARPGTALERIVRRYVAYRLRQAHQAVACHALHSVEERACRWLLTTHDGTRSAPITLTHEVLAEMLGVHRQTVSIVAGTLQRAGLIAYRRGQLEVRNSAGLRDAACECYGETRRLYERIMQ
jgi:CRP-like cAMP-binding protein